jgi:hypothetical protein
VLAAESRRVGVVHFSQQYAFRSGASKQIVPSVPVVSKCMIVRNDPVV